jgi:sugar-specific transcriptional regulator TrmB
MTDRSIQRRAVELLQKLGLKEYEAKSYVALSRLPQGTAKEISELSEVPRTRVYDAIGVLEAKGLVETQHSNPKRFRAVPDDEAVETLRSAYEDRTDALQRALGEVEPADLDAGTELTHEVWSLAGEAAVRGRVGRIADDATSEIVLIVVAEGVLTADLLERLRAAADRGVDVLVGASDESVVDRVDETLPAVETFRWELAWLSEPTAPDDGTELGRLLLVDRETMLVSTIAGDPSRRRERAVFGRGFDNGLVTVARRLMARGLAANAGDS